MYVELRCLMTLHTSRSRFTFCTRILSAGLRLSKCVSSVLWLFVMVASIPFIAPSAAPTVLLLFSIRFVIMFACVTIIYMYVYFRKQICVY